jgi:DNA-binding GntR family transcriptional regulator
MHVSQNTARDALHMLESEGWVTRKPRYGVYVCDFTPDQALETYTLRAALERLILDWAMPTLTLKDITYLRFTLLADAAAHAAISSDHAVRESLAAVHQTLIDRAGRAQTADFLRRLLNQCRLLDNLRAAHLARDTDQWRTVIASYRTLMEHIEKREAEHARDALHDIIMGECQVVLLVLDMLAKQR